MIKNSPFLAEGEGNSIISVLPISINLSEFLEVLDNKVGVGMWLPLDVPPTDPQISAGNAPFVMFTCAVSVQYPILGSRASRSFEVYVSHLERGLTQLNWEAGFPSLHDAEILFVKLHDNHGFLMLSCSPYHGNPILLVFFMSDD